MSAKKKGLFTSAHKLEPKFVTTGFNNWKNGSEKFSSHEKSSNHLNAIRMLQDASSSPLVRTLYSHQVKSYKDSQAALRLIMSSVLYLAQQGLPLRGEEHSEGNLMKLLQLRSQDVPEFQNWLKKSKPFTSWAIQNEILKIAAHAVLRKVVNQADGKIFSVIVDETSDIAVQEQVSICVRMVNNKLEPEEFFLGLYETSATTGEVLFKIIVDALQRMGLPINNLRGQCYDGAANMSGRFHGVKARIIEKQPAAIYVHCFNHSLNLAVQDALKSQTLIRDTLNTVHEIATLLRSSPKRMGIFREEVEASSESYLQPRPLCPTRWVLRVKSVDAVLASFQSIMNTLEEISSSNDKAAAKASGLLSQMEKAEFYFGLILAKTLLQPIEVLSRNLQEKSATVQGGIMSANITLQHLVAIKTNCAFEDLWSSMEENALRYQLAPAVLPRPRRPPKRFQTYDVERQFETVKERLRSIFFGAVESCVETINDRFSQEGVKWYSDLEGTLVNWKILPSRRDKLEEICSFYGWNTEKLCSELDVISSFSDMDWSNIQSIINSFRGLSIEAQLMFPNLRAYLETLVVVPCSSATAERSFSMLRRIKTYLRSTMSQARLNHCCVLNAYSDLVQTLDVTSLMKEFVAKGNREHIFGNVIET